MSLLRCTVLVEEGSTIDDMPTEGRRLTHCSVSAGVDGAFSGSRGYPASYGLRIRVSEVRTMRKVGRSVGHIKELGIITVTLRSLATMNDHMNSARDHKIESTFSISIAELNFFLLSYMSRPQKRLSW